MDELLPIVQRMRRAQALEDQVKELTEERDEARRLVQQYYVASMRTFTPEEAQDYINNPHACSCMGGPLEGLPCYCQLSYLKACETLKITP